MLRLRNSKLVYNILRASILANLVTVVSFSSPKAVTDSASPDLKLQEVALGDTLPDDINISIVVLDATTPSVSLFSNAIPADYATPAGADDPLVKPPLCYYGSDHPPNPEDCSYLIESIRNMHFTITLPHATCTSLSYRSCLMYMCASECEDGPLTAYTNGWIDWLLETQANCVTREGRAGFYYAVKPRWKGGLLGIGDGWPRSLDGVC
ncbi:hypothetical protein K491DRAFT_516322 [Lophiostoma macrostomum CBS 122681]|uniref:Uncharacterized protein n=1 Tax=Lophiostoma macrostomum CBS 122681 TaxID=1314788 RepID=A0A6A6T0A0_9PLEO|nr:hypothetical protein K491DRAFT_516322 [Lophiostoma macrostomum CBS 122681]